MIRTNYDWMIAKSAIQEVSLYFGADEIKLSNNEIGLFEIKDIDLKASKLAGVSGTNMIANAAFIEIHRSCIAEIEYILQTCQYNGTGLSSIVVERSDSWDNDIFSVYKAWNQYHSYRVTKAGDLRLYVGTDEGWEYDKTYESSPLVMFNTAFDRVYDYSHGMILEQGEIAENHEDIVNKHTREFIKNIVDIRRVFGIRSKDGNLKRKERFILLASIVDLHLIKEKGDNKSLNIAKYTYYDDVFECYRNQRIEMFYDEIVNADDNVKASKWHKEIVKLQGKMKKTTLDDLFLLYNLFLDAVNMETDTTDWLWSIYNGE